MILRLVGQTLLVAAITLALDFALTATLFDSVKRTLSGTAEVYEIYRRVPYHHDLVPDLKTTRIWGNVVYPWQTDRYGFRTGPCAPGEADKGRKAVFVIGDSFTEALGVPYEQSFAGLMACDAARQGKAVWHLGVLSYSPAIYHLKIRSAAERLGIKPAEIFAFLDLSDIDDDANVYRIGPDGVVYSDQLPEPAVQGQQPMATPAPAPRPTPAPAQTPVQAQAPPTASRPAQRTEPEFDFGQFLINNFTTARLAYDLYLYSTFSYPFSLGRPRARWSFDPALMEKWGRRGLEVGGGNLDRIVALCRDWQCRVTLVVYPWPDNVAAEERESLQVSHWRSWAAARGVRFVDGFAPFFRESAYTTIRRYYIPGDVHFTEAGHRLLFDAVKGAVGDW